MKRKALSSILALTLVASMMIHAAASGWELIYAGRRAALWGKGASISSVCAEMATSLVQAGVDDPSLLTNVYILTTLGIGTVATLAATTVGGTVYTEIYTMSIPYQPIHYMYSWTFVDSNGKTYGPFRYTPNPYSASSEDHFELEY